MLDRRDHTDVMGNPRFRDDCQYLAARNARRARRIVIGSAKRAGPLRGAKLSASTLLPPESWYSRCCIQLAFWDI